jgi:hypothetical protein
MVFHPRPAVHQFNRCTAGRGPFLWQNVVTINYVLVITALPWLNWMLASPMSRSDITTTAVLALAGSADRAAKRN